MPAPTALQRAPQALAEEESTHDAPSAAIEGVDEQKLISTSISEEQQQQGSTAISMDID